MDDNNIATNDDNTNNDDDNRILDNPPVRMTPVGNPVSKIKNGSMTESEVFPDALEWCRRASLLEHCPILTGCSKYRNTASNCNCLHALRPKVDGEESPALYMVARWACYVASLDNGTRTSLEIEWIKHANFWSNEHTAMLDKRRGYLLQVMAIDPSFVEGLPVLDEAGIQPFRGCKWALMLVLGIGESRWAKSTKHSRSNTFPVHGLKGKLGNKNAKKMARIDSDLKDFFEELIDEAEVPATRLVRELTGMGLRAGEEEKIELPTHMTKRGLYKQFCWQRGWNLVSDAKGNYTKTPRPYDTEFLDGSERQEVNAWSTFENYWKIKYPNLKIRASSEDICSECHIVAIRYKYRTFRELTRDGSISFSPDNAELLKAIRANSTADEEDEDDDADADDVALLKVALEHVVAAKAQRELHRRKNSESASAHATLPPLPRRQQVHSYTGDYCQNAGMPHMGSDQPGETYYYSALIVPIFGIAEPSIGPENDHLHAFVYYEHEAKKGGNNVCSLLWMYLDIRGLLNADDPIGELNWTFDNCPGQNKNRMVIRFFMFLVERGYFLKVNLIFLVKGHTKNLCDRAFNLLKIEYHNKNIYSTDKLMKVLNSHDQVTAIKVDASDFYDWDSMLDGLYKRPAGFTEDPHLFSFSADTPTCVSWSMYDGQPVTTKDLMKAPKRNRDKTVPNRDETLATTTLVAPPAPGMKDIKRMELWSKWRPLIPVEDRKDWFFLDDPGPGMAKQVLAERAERLARRKGAPTSLVPTPPTN
jgi:hypothetical protein